MESKKMIRIGMKLTEAIIEILKSELGTDEKKGRRNDEKRKRHVKRNSKGSR
jgi:hypothetical protein